MNDTRARFEEIWPVPRGCMWTDDNGYLPIDQDADHLVDRCIEHDARLDTFTRCQETTDVYVSIVDEMMKNMGLIEYASEGLYSVGVARESIGRAKQKLEQIK